MDPNDQEDLKIGFCDVGCPVGLFWGVFRLKPFWRICC